MLHTRSHQIRTPAVILSTIECYIINKYKLYVPSVPYRVTLVLLKQRELPLSGQSATPQTPPSVILICLVLPRHLVARITKCNTPMTKIWLVLMSTLAEMMCLTIKSRSFPFSKTSALRSQEPIMWTTIFFRLPHLSRTILETWSPPRSPKYTAVCS